MGPPSVSQCVRAYRGEAPEMGVTGLIGALNGTMNTLNNIIHTLNDTMNP